MWRDPWGFSDFSTAIGIGRYLPLLPKETRLGDKKSFLAKNATLCFMHMLSSLGYTCFLIGGVSLPTSQIDALVVLGETSL